MSKKLLGARTIGETDYQAGTIFTDEEAVATGLEASDFADVKEAPPAPEPKPTPSADADKDAEIDAQAPGEKNAEESSGSAGADTEQGAAPGSEAAA